MFNRTIETRIVKKSKKDEIDSDEPKLQPSHYLAIAKVGADTASKNIVKMIATYIALDTARKIAVSRLGK